MSVYDFLWNNCWQPVQKGPSEYLIFPRTPENDQPGIWPLRQSSVSAHGAFFRDYFSDWLIVLVLAVLGLPLLRAFSCVVHGCSFIAVLGFLLVVVALVYGLSGCCSWVILPCGMRYSWARDWTDILCIVSKFLNLWTATVVPGLKKFVLKYS